MEMFCLLRIKKVEHKTICFQNEVNNHYLWLLEDFNFVLQLYISLLESELSGTRKMVPYIKRFIVKNHGARRKTGILSREGPGMGITQIRWGLSPAQRATDATGGRPLRGARPPCSVLLIMPVSQSANSTGWLPRARHCL